MNSQEVRDLLMASDSETDIFDDDDTDPSYLPNARLECDSSSEDDQPKSKQRKIQVNSSEAPLIAPSITYQQMTFSSSPIDNLPNTSTSFDPANAIEATDQPNSPKSATNTLNDAEATSDQPHSPTATPAESEPTAPVHNPCITPQVKKKRLRSVEQRKNRDASLHPVRDGCSSPCKKKCSMTFGPEDRQQINQHFWSFDVEQRRQWIWDMVVQEAKKRPTVENDDSRRHRTYNYQFRRPLESGGGLKEVCKVFFLTTLGYNKSSDAAIMRILHSAPPEDSYPNKDQRGKHEPHNKLNHVEIREHIKSYNPAVHHYRREHAPNRLYLPSDITITDMHSHFCANVRNISMESYRKEVKNMNISFVLLGAEKCEVCRRYTIHKEDIGKDTPCECETCLKKTIHDNNTKSSRAAYQADASRPKEPDEIVTSVDMQKVIMLPRLPGLKSCAFTRRIIAFNETFAGLGQSSKNVAVVWHEAVSGRNADDVCSAYWAFFLRERDARKITLWGDNCCAQNKNWTFYSFLATVVNSADIAAEEITFKYLEVGHTFMAADSVHHSIDRELKKRGDVRDWQEYVETLESAKCKVVSMDSHDFKTWKDVSNRNTTKNAGLKLSDIMIVQFRRGHRALFYKTAIDETTPFTPTEFLQKKHTNLGLIPDGKTTTRGITTSKKEGIIKTLCPMMSKTRKLFWERLAINDEANDLINNY